MKIEVKERREFQHTEQREILASWTGGQQGLGSSRTRVDTDTDHPAQHPRGWLSKMPK